MPESVVYEKNGHKPEISFVWNKSETQSQTVSQKVELFSTVNVRLSKHDNDPLKINVGHLFTLFCFSERYLILIYDLKITMMHPKEKVNKRAFDASNRQVSTKCEADEEAFYSQRIDIDPYICD